jgi:hypothetical protein
MCSGLPPHANLLFFCANRVAARELCSTLRHASRRLVVRYSGTDSVSRLRGLRPARALPSGLAHGAARRREVTNLRRPIKFGTMWLCQLMDAANDRAIEQSLGC